jgi:hypothetical protein
MSIKSALKSLPIVGPALIRWRAGRTRFEGSADYWESRYREGGNSGAGSYSRLAEFKAEVINKFVAENQIKTVIEFGSGDGAQLRLADYPAYTGVDVSRTAVEATRRAFASDTSKSFYHTSELPVGTTAELSMSLDVIYHLVEDQVFESYMNSLFGAATRFVIVYASNENKPWPNPHVRHRKFTDWVSKHQPGFSQVRHIPNRYPWRQDDVDNTSFADFYMFAKN